MIFPGGVVATVAVNARFDRTNFGQGAPAPAGPFPGHTEAALQLTEMPILRGSRQSGSNR